VKYKYKLRRKKQKQKSSRPNKSKWYPFKSKLEYDFNELIKKGGKQANYEKERIPFVKSTHYLPDFEIAKNVFIETKGYFSSSNRTNLLEFLTQHPDMTVLMVFGNSQNRLNSKSKITYAQWCDKHGVEWWDIRDGLPYHFWKKYADNKSI
jgi:hypothetical protein